jgi:carbamoyl-phosphate synthase large subunit
MINVLITGVGGCGVGEGIVKALLPLRDRYRVVTVNMTPNAVSLFRSDAGYLVPPANAPTYLDHLLDVCSRERIEVIIPGSEAELRVLARKTCALAQAKLVLLANPREVIDIGDDKWITYLFLRDHGFETPQSWLPGEGDFADTGLSFPLILKPRSGHASQNVFRVRSREELDLLLSWYRLNGLEPIVQEMVGDPETEYTTSVAVGRDGEVLGSIAMRRTLLGGFSQSVEVEAFDDIRREAEAIARALHARGPINIQSRMTQEGPKAFEINPRFSGTTPFRALVGFNEVDLLLQNFVRGVKPEVPVPRHGVFGIRALEEVIVTREEFTNRLQPL